MDLPLHGVLGYGQVPNEILYMAAERGVTVLVPRLDAITCEWFANPADPFGFSDYARGVLEEQIPHYGKEGINADVVVIMAATDAIRSMSRLVMVFIYGFVGMLTLIGLTNVISTISTNMRARKREFAVLQSTGMTREGLKRMLNLESILCSARSLLYGLPIGAAAAWLIYRFVIQSADFPFAFPWLAMGECVLGVFVVTWVAMRYSARQMQGGSVVEGIRQE
jgi:putative ABC transport system permease protein